MESIATYLGYIVMILGFVLVIFLLIMKIWEYMSTPRKMLYRKLDRLAKTEPEVFLNFSLFIKRKYHLRHKSLN
ncbi:MAG: hypothetical protein PHO62_07580 [Sulfurimonas sp.]|uniref:hypothetical protein n=1 Tax=Sulfurimonas sp. TaxID=2022749 RepID=UPI002620E28D|nr:hypothetical protein [Sulfurimonas sp.]MDD5373266.1 hypothetical protein [Sulfurimonas sp.]